MRVVMITWIESEAGFGQRNDGCSLHADDVMAAIYIKDHWNLESEQNQANEVPEVYSRPASEIGRLVEISGGILRTFRASVSLKKSGIMLWEDELRTARQNGELVEVIDP